MEMIVQLLDNVRIAVGMHYAGIHMSNAPWEICQSQDKCLM